MTLNHFQGHSPVSRISLNQWMDFFKLASIYHCDKLKNGIDFGDLDLIFKVIVL